MRQHAQQQEQRGAEDEADLFGRWFFHTPRNAHIRLDEAYLPRTWGSEEATLDIANGRLRMPTPTMPLTRVNAVPFTPAEGTAVLPFCAALRFDTGTTG